MNKTKDISRLLKGKVSPKERYFRVLLTYLIRSGRVNIIYDEQEFCKEIKSIEGEGEVYEFLIQRRNEFIGNINDLLLGQLMKT
tara:strand:- start:279 stop:530 length:252 start_codon:yes stop_codon:yes gene_type:complete